MICLAQEELFPLVVQDPSIECRMSACVDPHVGPHRALLNTTIYRSIKYS